MVQIPRNNRAVQTIIRDTEAWIFVNAFNYLLKINMLKRKYRVTVGTEKGKTKVKCSLHAEQIL